MEILVCLRLDSGPADWAALEAGLSVPDGRVTVASVGLGPLPETGEPSVLDLALSVGVARSVYLSVPGEHDPLSEPNPRGVAEALLAMATEADLVICGHDRSTGSAGAIPAFLAALLKRPQILAALDLELVGDQMRCTCLADEGRRALYSSQLPAVISIVPGTAKLRRAALSGLVSEAKVETRTVVGRIETRADRLGIKPPRTHLVAAPSSGSPIARVLELTKATEELSPAKVVRCEPAEAATLAIEALVEWGYL